MDGTVSREILARSTERTSSQGARVTQLALQETQHGPLHNQENRSQRERIDSGPNDSPSLYVRLRSGRLTPQRLYPHSRAFSFWSSLRCTQAE